MDKQRAPEVRVVAEWHEALNGGDVERLLFLSHPDVEVGGPRGTGRGSQLLRDWANRAGIHLAPQRYFHSDELVVVEQAASWISVDTGETTSPQAVASVFVVRDGSVASLVRYEDLTTALGEAGLDESDAIGNA